MTDTFNDLKRAVSNLETAEKNLIGDLTAKKALEALIEELKSPSLINQEAVKTALPVLQQGLLELQQSPIEFINSVIAAGDSLNSLQEAAILVQSYFKVTKHLDQTLTQLSNTLSSLSSNLTGTVKNLASSVAKLVSNPSSLASPGYVGFRRNLREKLGASEGELSSTSPAFDEKNEINLLVNESQKVLDILNNAALPVSTRIAGFVTHLKEAREILKTLSRRGISWGGSEVGDVQIVRSHWETAIQIISNLSKTAASTDPQQNRLFISQSIKIHDLLEQNYSYLADLVRSGDLISSGTL